MAVEEITDFIAALRQAGRLDLNEIRDILRFYDELIRGHGLPPKFYPKAGHVLMCHFLPVLIGREIWKVRPVVVLATTEKDLYLVVGLSTVAPDKPKEWHLEIPAGTIPGLEPVTSWVKGDVIHLVSRNRLEKIRDYETNKYMSPTFGVGHVTLTQIRYCVQQALHNSLKHDDENPFNPALRTLGVQLAGPR